MFSLEDIKKFIFIYRPEGLIVDTNVLILFLIGSYDPAFIESCQILNNSNKKYSDRDFELLKEIFAFFKKLIILPQNIAELSNLSVTSGGIYGDKLTAYLQTIIKFLKSAKEHHQNSSCLWGMELKIIARFGFTDMTMFELSRQANVPILTDEFPFYNYAYGKIPIIKFEHIKLQNYQPILK